MLKSLIIDNISVAKHGKYARLSARIKWSFNERIIFFDYPISCLHDLDQNSADAFLIATILIAIKNNEDVEVKQGKVSLGLLSNLENLLIPTLHELGLGNGKTRIECNIKVPESAFDNDRIGATGISLGIDSFYSLLKNINNELTDNIINAVVYFVEVSDEGIISKQQENELKIRWEVASKLNLLFIPIISNVRDVLETEFVFSQFHTYVHIAGVIGLYKRIKFYYYATAYTIKEMNPNFSDSATYDNILSETFSTDIFEMLCSGKKTERLEKTRWITNYEITYDYLDVCLHGRFKSSNYINCSYCPKCIRTMTSLDILNSLGKYNKVFDLEKYEKYKAKFWADVEYRRIIGKDPLSREIHREAIKVGYKIPKRKWIYIIIIGIRNQLMKVVNIFKKA